MGAQKKLPKKLADRERARISKIVKSLPEAEVTPTDQHLALEVRKKRFGWFLVDHHGDARIALNCKATADTHDILKQLLPKHFHVPKYMGSKGWVGIWLDTPGVDWNAVELALHEAYRCVAPKSLVKG
jgi:hypothetical protein